MTESILPEEPEKIVVAEDIRAVRIGRHYMTSFPYDPRASEVMRMVPSAYWDPRMKGWSVQARRHEVLEKALRKIDRLLGPERHEIRAAEQAAEAREAQERSEAAAHPARKRKAPRKRILVPVSDVVVEGDVLEKDGKYLFVQSVGRPFRSTSRKPGLYGTVVQYAYHRPAKEAEIEAYLASQEADQTEVAVTRPEPDRSDEPDMAF
jgi:hypothetical protein